MARRPPRLGPARAAAATLLAVAVLVQAFVWGAVRPTGDGGAVLPGLRGVFGVGYAAVLIAAELGLCAWFRMAQAAVWVLVVSAAVDVVFVCAGLAGLHFRSGAAAAVTAGFGALVLAGGILTGRFIPERRAP